VRIFIACLALSLHLVAPACSGSQPEGFAALSGPYLGQKPPGLVPEVFAEGVISSVSMIHGKIVFSADGSEVYWECMAAPVQSRWHAAVGEGGRWSQPEASFLSVEDSEAALFLTADGTRAFYHSRRTGEGERETGDKDIWYRERTEGVWREPVNLGSPVNSVESDEWAPAVASDGTIYFCREAARGHHGSRGHSAETGRPNDIYFSTLVDGKYTEPVSLGPEVNSDTHDVNPAVAPDNSYLLFTSGRPGGYSAMMNLYVSFRRKDGTWAEAVCLSEVFEIPNIWFPSLTPDGKYLFFCGGFPTQDGYTASDYYWVSTEAIERLRP
jgi:hypothetical protein